MQKMRLFSVFLLMLAAGASAQEVPYTACPGCWNPDSLGNHRAVVRFGGPGTVAHVIIPWRLCVADPAAHRIIVQDAQTGARVREVRTIVLSRESGEIAFRAASAGGHGADGADWARSAGGNGADGADRAGSERGRGADRAGSLRGVYYVYYLPYRNEGRSNYPKGVYWGPDTTAASGLAEVEVPRAINCKVVGFQSIDTFNTFYPMEVIATRAETDALVKRNAGRAFLVFPEDREHAIRMQGDLPYRWIKAKDRVNRRAGRGGAGPGNVAGRGNVASRGSVAGRGVAGIGSVAGGGVAGRGVAGVRTEFRDTADRGEYYAYQLGVYALQPLEDVQVQFSELTSVSGGRIPVAASSCINIAGVSYDGHPFTKTVNISRGRVQPLWCGVDLPMDIPPGVYTGTATVTARSGGRQVVRLQINVSGSGAIDGGAGEPQKMTRLKWLNSTLAQENTVIAPYIPLVIQGDTLIRLLGRDVRLGQQGFPEQLQTFFSPENTAITATPNNLLAENIHFHFTLQSTGKDIRLKPQGLRFTERSPGTVSWKAVSASDELRMEVSGSLEFDGFMSYTVAVIALADLDLKDIVMHIPFQKEEAVYLMGLGRKGGYRPDSMYHWKWDVAHKNQDGAWIGTVNAGLYYSLRDEHYVRPLNTNFYLAKPLMAPTSWANGGNGGIDIGIKGKSMLANNYSGQRHMRKGDTLYYNFNLLLTPFHTLNTEDQWTTRYYHKYNDLESIRATGATVVNIHHATPINPWINYPFVEWKSMKAYIDTAHRMGLKVKIYNTVRELSDHAYETFALRSLGTEIYSPGPGKGFAWLQEHLGNNYIPAWFVPAIKDAAIINSGMSRWHNYYVEGMNWLVQHVGIDGIYLDDVAFDRVTMKRIKRVLTQNGHPGIIDLHSANQYNPRDGFNNSANLYMEHFPYLNRLWFGEYFDYEHNPPDFFLTEVSGIPFGLMGEMLEGGGNPWRGMVYGMTCRMPWTDNADPRPIWKLWDAFGMKGAKMIGYWSPACPVRTGREDIPATVYQKPGALLVALASWAPQDTTVRLDIDWKSIGIDPVHGHIEAPAIEHFQPARQFAAGDPIPVERGKGWLLIIRP
jgi:glycosyl hydrolase family 123